MRIGQVGQSVLFGSAAVVIFAREVGGRRA